MKPIKVLANANDAILALGESGPLTPAAIAERIGIPRPSVYRLLDGLNAIGLTETLPDSSARLSLRWLHLADSAREGMVEWAGSDEILGELVDETRQTAYLSVPRTDEAVCIEWVQGRAIGVLILKPGRTLPLYAGAAGRALLAELPDLDGYLSRSSRPRFNEHTLVEPDELRRDVEQTRARGYSISEEDVTEGIDALGVAITHDGSARGVLSLAGLSQEFRENREAYLPALMKAAGRLTDIV